MLQLFNKLRPQLQLFVYYIIPLLLLGTFLFIANYQFFSFLGTAALLVLSFVLYIKPLAVLTPWKFFKIAMTFRREIGILSFWLFVGHASGLYISKVYRVKDIFNLDLFLIWGALAGLGLTIMALTSNNVAMRVLKQHWKKLHRSVYLIYYLVLIHMALARGELIFSLLLGIPYAVLKFFEFKKTSNIRQR